MKRGLQGHYVTISTVGEKVKAFVPAPLPPEPPIDWTPDLRDKFDHVASILQQSFNLGYVRKIVLAALDRDG